MPENTGDKPLETPGNPPPESLLKQVIPVKTNDVIIKAPQIESISVPPVHQEKKKNWKSYSWEFLMLFLAVFCGFLAQYYLEHRIDKERGHQYVRFDDRRHCIRLNEDQSVLRIWKKTRMGLDSLSVLFNNPPYNDSTIKRMYLLMLQYTMNAADVAFTKKTVSQLKNSGGMRLISNKISADEITQYMEAAEAIELQGEFFRNIAVNDVVKLNNKIFYLKYIRGIKRSNIDSFMTRPAVRLASTDENLLVEYSNQLFFTAGVLINYNNKLASLKSTIASTIETLKRENDID